MACWQRNSWIDMSLTAPAEIRMINSIAAHFGYLRAEQAGDRRRGSHQAVLGPADEATVALACGLRHKGSRTSGSGSGGAAAVTGYLTDRVEHRE